MNRRVLRQKTKIKQTECLPQSFEKIESDIYLKLTVTQRGVIQKLLERNKSIQTSLLLAILGLKVKPQYKHAFPDLIYEGGQNEGKLGLVLPRTLLNQLFKKDLIKIKTENI